VLVLEKGVLGFDGPALEGIRYLGYDDDDDEDGPEGEEGMDEFDEELGADI